MDQWELTISLAQLGRVGLTVEHAPDGLRGLALDDLPGAGGHGTAAGVGASFSRAVAVKVH